MPIGNKIDNFEEQIKIIKNHPLAKENFEVQIAYLDGIALMMNEDSDINEKELDFLKLMIRSLNINEAACNDFIAFAENPDDERVMDSFKILQDTPNMKLLFMIDSIIMANKDNIVKKEEGNLIDKYAKLLNIDSDTKLDLQIIVNNLIKKNGAELAKIIEDCKSISKNDIQFLISFFDVKDVKIIKKIEDNNLKQTGGILGLFCRELAVINTNKNY